MSTEIPLATGAVVHWTTDVRGRIRVESRLHCLGDRPPPYGRIALSFKPKPFLRRFRLAARWEVLFDLCARELLGPLSVRERTLIARYRTRLEQTGAVPYRTTQLLSLWQTQAIALVWRDAEALSCSRLPRLFQWRSAPLRLRLHGIFRIPGENEVLDYDIEVHREDLRAVGRLLDRGHGLPGALGTLGIYEGLPLSDTMARFFQDVRWLLPADLIDSAVRGIPRQAQHKRQDWLKPLLSRALLAAEILLEREADWPLVHEIITKDVSDEAKHLREELDDQTRWPTDAELRRHIALFLVDRAFRPLLARYMQPLTHLDRDMHLTYKDLLPPQARYHFTIEMCCPYLPDYPDWGASWVRALLGPPGALAESIPSPPIR